MKVYDEKRIAAGEDLNLVVFDGNIDLFLWAGEFQKALAEKWKKLKYLETKGGY
ncbi:MAG: hypothetical protein AB7V39_00595 [Nitrospiraceae bacterium]